MNICRTRVVDQGMSAGPSRSMPARVSVGLLVLLTLFVSVVRPLNRPPDALTRSLGRQLTRINLRSEASVNNDTSLPAPAERRVDPLELPLALGLLLLLRTRCAARRAVPVLRLKIPPPRTSNTLLSD